MCPPDPLAVRSIRMASQEWFLQRRRFTPRLWSVKAKSIVIRTLSLGSTDNAPSVHPLPSVDERYVRHHIDIDTFDLRHALCRLAIFPMSSSSLYSGMLSLNKQRHLWRQLPAFSVRASRDRVYRHCLPPVLSLTSII